MKYSMFNSEEAGCPFWYMYVFFSEKKGLPDLSTNILPVHEYRYNSRYERRPVYCSYSTRKFAIKIHAFVNHLVLFHHVPVIESFTFEL